jgi:hypothetical protein
MTVREPALDERVVLLSEALEGAGLPYAFGGALAAAYCAEPRATVDIDVNVFVGVDRASAIIDALRPLGVAATPEETNELTRDAQVRVRWGRYPLDLFLSNHPLHDVAENRVRRVPFAATEIPILSCEDLVVFKAFFNRTKDWLDIEQILFGYADFDIGYVEHWLRELAGPDDDRVRRLAEALRNASGQ